MASVELERTLIKSQLELWEELAANGALVRRLGDVRLGTDEAPNRLAWESDVAQGVIELEASGWGTTVRATADSRAADGSAGDIEIERRLTELLDDLGSSSLQTG